MALSVSIDQRPQPDIILELNKKKAPISVENFVKYVEKGYYDGTIFHRVIPKFMVQGGGFDEAVQEKTAGRDKPIKNEWKNGLKNVRGAIAMARTAVADSATSQFFINVMDNPFLDEPRDGAGYAVFGKVIAGMDTVDRICAVRTGDHAGMSDVPVESVTITRAVRVSADKRSAGEGEDVGGREQSRPAAGVGSGFFVSSEGHLVTADHVIGESTRMRVRTQQGEYPARVLRRDSANDLAVLKVEGEGEFASLHVLGSARLRLADRVCTIGFPNPDLQGLAPKFSAGEVAALSGPGDDPRFIQISVPVQPGNSGGALMNAAGSVVGVVTGKLSLFKTLEVTGQIPENVNYAIKGTLLLGLLEAVPGLTDKLADPPVNPPKESADLARLVEAATAMVIVE